SNEGPIPPIHEPALGSTRWRNEGSAAHDPVGPLARGKTRRDEELRSRGGHEHLALGLPEQAIDGARALRIQLARDVVEQEDLLAARRAPSAVELRALPGESEAARLALRSVGPRRSAAQGARKLVPLGAEGGRAPPQIPRSARPELRHEGTLFRHPTRLV